MLLRYTLKEGQKREFKLEKRAVTIGRSPEADIYIPDKSASRIHCGIFLQDGVFFLQDFKSKNGTLVNNRGIDVVRLQGGDKISVGATTIMVEEKRGKGPQTVFQEIQREMDKGKGYNTMLLEIIKDDKT